MSGLKLEEIKVPDYERVVYAEHPSSGLRSIIAVHNTVLGPACGGIRLLPYATKAEALNDVLRLSKGMSYKSSLAGIGFGGGKSVIICEPGNKSKELLHAFGSFVETFGGKYIAAKDMNIESNDLLLVREITKNVLGIDGVPGSSGDPSPMTARGVFQAFRAANEAIGNPSLRGVKIAIQGIGHVGYAVAQKLFEQGAELWVTDINEAMVQKACKELKAKPISGDAIFDLPCDIFSPNARGAVLNARTIPRLKCKAVVGAANNQLETPEDGVTLFKKGILYAPDFAVNAGGIINVFMELDGYSESRAAAKTDGIYQTMKTMFARSREENVPPFIVADKLAEERMYGKAR